jgi:chorismate mutase
MSTIDELRHKIEEIDASIIQQLAIRVELSKQIGQLKLDHGADVVDPLREKKLYAFYDGLCEQYQLSSVFIKRLFKIIIIHSRQVQKS